MDEDGDGSPDRAEGRAGPDTDAHGPTRTDGMDEVDGVDGVDEEGDGDGSPDMRSQVS